MRLAKKLALLVPAIAAWAVLMAGSAVAQPLVTGDLLYYFDFEEIVDNAGELEFLDGSGNAFNGTIHEGTDTVPTTGTLTLETTDVKRGGGAALFTQSTVEGEGPVFVDVHGEDVTANHPELLPASTGAFTMAAWLNVNETGGDQSIFQGTSGLEGFRLTHGAPHFQLQGGGGVRFVWRNLGSQNVVSRNVYLDGTEVSSETNHYPFNEWFHYAGTYDKNTNEFAMYFNGQLFHSGQSTEPGAGTDPADWGSTELEGDFFTTGFGAVYDSGGRRLDGLMDELYVFSRALTAEEIFDLYDIGPAFEADFDGDGDVDGDDFLAWQTGYPTESGAQKENGDYDNDGDVDGDDFLGWQTEYPSPGAGAGSGAVPEPNTLGLLVLAGLALTAVRKRLV